MMEATGNLVTVKAEDVPVESKRLGKGDWQLRQSRQMDLAQGSINLEAIMVAAVPTEVLGGGNWQLGDSQGSSSSSGV